MVGVFAPGVLALGSRNWRLSKKTVGVNHVVDDAALRNLLGLELGFDGENVPIVVAEMVVGEDGQRLDTGVDQEFSEIMAPNKGTFVCRSNAQKIIPIERCSNIERNSPPRTERASFYETWHIARHTKHRAPCFAAHMGS